MGSWGLFLIEVPGDDVAEFLAGVVGLKPLVIQHRLGIAKQALADLATSPHFPQN